MLGEKGRMLLFQEKNWEQGVRVRDGEGEEDKRIF
jgi:hypothetical protein